MARTTLQTIADEVGVSRMTVSNAFSRPDQLSADLRATILAAADRLGYAGPDPSGRALARGRTDVIGMVLTDSPRDAFTDDVAVGFVGSVAATLGDAGYSLVLLHSSPRPGSSAARDVAMDGAIVYSCSPRAEEIGALTERRLPVVTVETDAATATSAVAISIDNAGGAAAAARHLVDLGHRDIALVVTSADATGDVPSDAMSSHASATIRGRLDGWRTGLDGVGITPRVYGTTSTDLDDLLRERISMMLDTAPTAVLAYSDRAALEVIDQARARGLRVPEDLSVIGFDDSPIASRVRPALTTVRQDVSAKGEAAASALLRMLAGEKADDRVIPTELVVRDSTAAPRR